MSDLLSVEGLSVAYGEHLAVRGVSLSVAQGKTIAILGANGAGKSSTLKAIAGLVGKTAGRVVLDGEDVTRASAMQLVRRGLCYVPEDREIVGSLSVGENLTLGGYHVPRALFRERRDRVLELFPELAARLQRGAWGLSGGEQQMLAIGRALMAGPRVLLLDEPSLGLAPSLQQRVFAKLTQLRADTGLTILLVEQNLAMAARFSDRAVVLRNGTVAASADETQLRDPAARTGLVEAYLGHRPISNPPDPAVEGGTGRGLECIEESGRAEPFRRDHGGKP